MSTGALGTTSASHDLRFDSGRICLDLLATSHPEERLDSVVRLRAWCRGEGLVPQPVGLVTAGDPGRAGLNSGRGQGSGHGAGQARPGAGARAAGGPRSVPLVLPAATTLWVVAFRALRGNIGQLVRGELDGRPATAALEYVNALARQAPPAPCAVRAGDGTLVRALHSDPGCAELLALLARDAVDLLTDPVARARLRRCEGDNCPLIYIDTSRGRRRRWCSSGACGNRERVARHRRRAALARA